ncbi:MAG: comF family protein [Parcubacteria bacterium C7867-001]|nr:MAG: comF family protein [Parcubacteria bacterium C7867-001]
MGPFSFLLDLLFPPRVSKQLERNANMEALAPSVSPITLPSEPFPTVALLSYRDPLVQGLIVELKYHESRRAVGLLATVLADYLLPLVAEDTALASSPRFMLVPVPLGRTRRSERGYNQVERICRAASHYMKDTIPTEASILKRTRDTAPQTTLSASERRTNMRGAFVAAHPLDPTHTYILVDDVTTTGATLAAAVEALREGGATHILPVALAH